MGEDLDVDARFVHGLDAPFAQILQTLAHEAAGGGVDTGKMGGHLRIVVVLFDGDDPLAVQDGHGLSLTGRIAAFHDTVASPRYRGAPH